ncbi:hypothetical protein V6K52_19740 [Knoellia sp. S7-12]|uniref:hypothetical protein n=1 Tax=Knoellia sp. S7-12 TaxID=3126698 RepID=UPI0033666093
MPFRDRLRSAHRRPWLGGGLALALVAATALAVAVMSGGDDPATKAPTQGPVTMVGAFDSSDLATEGWQASVDGGSAATLTDKRPYSGRSALVLDTRDSSGSGDVRISRSRLPVAAGQTYHVAAFAQPVAGQQRLVLAFEEASGRRIAQVSAATGTSSAWSRVTAQAAAPAEAVTATVLIIADDRTSAVKWDEVRLLSTDVPGSGFEGNRGNAVDDWTVRSMQGDRVRLSPDAHTGTAAIEISGRNSQESAATSARVPVFPDVTHNFSAWVRPVRGVSRLNIDWFDTQGRLVRSSPHNVSAPTGEWSRASFDASAPGTATSATMTVAPFGDEPSVSRWDDFTITPVKPRTPPNLRTKTVAQLDGFLTTTTSDVITVTGRPQLVTVVSGEPATFQVADLQSGALLHRTELPGLTNGWALTKGRTADGRGVTVYVGGGNGHVWRYDALSRSMNDLGRATPDATLVWDLDTDDDGVVWGASYPRAELWSFDPATAKFTLRGRVDPSAAYARGLAVDDKHIFVGTGPSRPHIVMLPRTGTGPPVSIQPPTSIAKGFVKQLDRRGRFLFARFTGDVYGLYDLTTKAWVTLDGPADVSRAQVPSAAPPGESFYYVRDQRIWKVAGSGPASRKVTAIATTSLPPGRNSLVVGTTIGGVPGAWLITHDGGLRAGAVNLSALRAPGPGKPLPAALHQNFQLGFKPSALHIKSLAAGSDGLLYVGGFGGPSFVAFRPDGEVALRYPSTDDQSPRVFGEIEGMIANGSQLYLGSYTGARILKYDTAGPWVPDTNPVQIGSLGPSFRQDRPQAWAVDGARTYFGTVPSYGTLGGAFGWIDGPDSTPVSMRSPVPNESVVSIAGRDGIAFVGTSRWGGLGTTPTADNATVFAYDTRSRRVLWQTHPVERAQSISALTITSSGRLWGVSGGTLFELDRATGTRIRQLHLTTDVQPDTVTWSVAQVVEVDGLLYVASRGSLHLVDPGSLTVTTVQAKGVAPNKVTVLGDALYYPLGSALVRAAPQASGRGSASGQ